MRHHKVALAVLALLMPIAAFAAPMDCSIKGISDSLRIYRACVYNSVPFLMQSPDSASDIAAASIASCQDTKSSLQTAAAACKMEGGLDSGMELLTADMRGQIILHVVSTRAKKAAGIK